MNSGASVWNSYCEFRISYCSSTTVLTTPTTPETIVNCAKVYQPQLGRRNPAFTPIFQRATDAQSFYDSLQVRLIKRYSRGLRAQVSYTLARATDDASVS